METFLDDIGGDGHPRNKVPVVKAELKRGYASSKFFTSSFRTQASHPAPVDCYKGIIGAFTSHTFCSQQEASGEIELYRLDSYHRYWCEHSDNRHADDCLAHLTSGIPGNHTGMSFTSKGLASISFAQLPPRAASEVLDPLQETLMFTNTSKFILSKI